MRYVDIQTFVERLCRIDRQQMAEGQVEAYLAENAILPQSLRRYVFYSTKSYTRNLIYRCETFEVLTICWEVGQGSPIHNHMEQRCWMAVPIGKLLVRTYDAVEHDPKSRLCRLEDLHESVHDSENPSTVDLAHPIHEVLNAASFTQQATSVHIYSLPYDRCLVYSLGGETYREVPLTYTTRYGVLQSAGE